MALGLAATLSVCAKPAANSDLTRAVARWRGVPGNHRDI